MSSYMRTVVSGFLGKSGMQGKILDLHNDMAGDVGCQLFEQPP